MFFFNPVVFMEGTIFFWILGASIRHENCHHIPNYSDLKMDGADFCNAPSIDHLRDGVFCAIYRFPTHVLENNLFSSRLVYT